MTKTVQSFLTELYEIDPSLKQHEADLSKLIEILLKNQPKPQIDQQFVEMLRGKLGEKAATLQSTPSSFFSFMKIPTYSLAILGVLLGVIITGPTVYYMSNPTNQTLVQQPATDFFAYDVKSVGNRAFGDLSTETSPGKSRSQSGGGGGAMGGGPAIDAAMPVTNEMSEKMIAPVPPGDYTVTQFNYVYKGEDYALPTSDVTVLKRIKEGLNLPSLSALYSADLGVMKLSAFPNLKIDSVSVYQDSKNGYSIYISERDGSVSISQNWDQWDHPESRCRDQKCYDALRLKQSDVPSDAAIIAIAENFLKDFGFTLKNVGSPYVDNGWKIGYEAMADKSQFYIPEQMSVVYPLLIEGKEVHEQYGGKLGVSVSVDIRHKKVAGVWNLTNQTYESSTYPAVSDKEAITTYLKNFEKADLSYMPKEAKIQNVDVELGTPKEGLVHMFTFKNDVQQDLYVPALIFPVTKRPVGKDLYFYRDSITVPLAKDLLEDANRPMPIDGPPVRIMEGDAAK